MKRYEPSITGLSKATDLSIDPYVNDELGEMRAGNPSPGLATNTAM